MLSDYKYEQIMSEMKDDLSKAEKVIELWSNVRYAAKKDGTPYKNLVKNIIGADVLKKKFAVHSYEKELCVSGWDKNSRYAIDAFDLYVPVQYATTDYLEKKQNIADDVYILDLDDIKNTISNMKIPYWKAEIENLNYCISHFAEVCKRCDEFSNELNQLCKKQALYYAAANYLKYVL